MSKVELAEFLRRRREALSADDAPTVTRGSGRARRTPGLRREEVAELAGVSTNYYERLEQARAPRPSPGVVAALGAALRLTAPEQDHLARIADLTRDETSVDEVDDIQGLESPPGLIAAQELLARVDDVPAYVVDARQRIRAWNAAAVALIVDFAALPAHDRTVTRLALRFAGTLCTESESARGGFASAHAAEMRASRARRPHDSLLAEQVHEFAAASPQFVQAWRNHDVRPRPVVTKHLSHPEVGELEVEHRTLLVPGTDLRVVMYTAEPDSPSAAALAALPTARAADTDPADTDPGVSPSSAPGRTSR